MLISQAEMDAILNRKIRRRYITCAEKPKVGSIRVLTAGKTPAIKVTILDVQPDGPGWLVRFARGDTRAFLLQDVPVFLARDGGYTTRQSRQAVPGDPEVAKLPGAAENARVMALARRQAPAANRINGLRDHMRTVREEMTAMKARNRCKLIERELDKLRAELPVSEIVA